MEALMKEVFGSGFAAEFGYAVDEVSVLFPRDQIARACALARSDPRLKMDYLRCLAVSEYPEYFQVAYMLYSIPLKHKAILKTNAPKNDPVVPSVTPVWTGANWHEREGAELYGVSFAGHPDPRYLLLFEEFAGKYPLRKDFPYEEINEWTPQTANWEAKP
jgi:NADH-quinone oxidoreductase subunit C